jgi:molecular chaperone GrpE
MTNQMDHEQDQVADTEMDESQPPVDEVAVDDVEGEVDEIITLQEELSAARIQADEYLDGWQRARADFANYKKRVERERSLAYQNASADIITRYLDVVDDMARALDNRPQEGEGATWADGIELIYRKLLTILENAGVTLMQIEGETFDPNLHEAISVEENPDYESGQVIEVLKQGYMLGDRVLRPASVRVAD